MPLDAERKATLQAARLFKKLKGMNDPLVTKASSDDATKARVKKARTAIEKAADAKTKVTKALMKAGASKADDASSVRRLALTNSQRNEIGAYPATLPMTDSSTVANPEMTETPGAAGIRSQREAVSNKKKAVAACLSGSRPTTTPAPRIELNRKNTKRTVRVTAKAVANTPTKRMHMMLPDLK
ncbi:hypothetical protein MMC07_007449 [Pseudocyphellaria aurata]|nr:hypothetical protein [Pseudocyphellaria aurata]